MAIKLSTPSMFFSVGPERSKVSWLRRMEPLASNTPSSSARAGSVFTSRRFRITSSELELESDKRVLKRPAILEKSLAFEAVISPSTASISAWEVTTIQARPPQIVPRFSVSVCRVSIKRVSLPMNWPTSSTMNTMRWVADCDSKNSFTQWQKFSTETLKLVSDSSNHLCAASGERSSAAPIACSISSW